MRDYNREEFQKELKKLIQEAKEFNKKFNDENCKADTPTPYYTNNIENLNMSELFNNGKIETNSLKTKESPKILFSKRPNRDTIIEEDEIERLYLDLMNNMEIEDLIEKY